MCAAPLTFFAVKSFRFSCGAKMHHQASLTGLLGTRKELVRAIARSLYAGYRLRDLIIVEFCNTADGIGMFRKYSAFIVGDRILPHTLMHSENWITKSHGRVIDATTAREELEYVQKNPHAKWLEETFALARIRYGRIDYGLLDGKPQVWEIKYQFNHHSPGYGRANSRGANTSARIRCGSFFFPAFRRHWKR